MLIRSLNSQMKKMASRGEMNEARATMHPHIAQETNRHPSGAPWVTSVLEVGPGVVR
jgi:hypothetical protein